MPQISASQANKEVTLNAIVDALSPAALYGRNAVTTAALTWGYLGGTVSISGTPTQVANGTVTLAASATNYIEANPATGAVSVNQTGFTSGRTPLYSVVTGAATVSNYTDLRVLGGGGGGATTDDIADAIAAHEAESDPHTQYQKESEKGAANGYASLDSGGKLPTSQLPNLAIIDFLGTAANQTAMLALTGEKGDWCARSDNSKVYVITGSDPTSIGSWTALSYPTGTGGTVTSVDLSVPGVLYNVSGNPVTTSGTLTFSLKTQTANTFLAGPVSGAAATPTMRSLVAADMGALLAAVNVFTKNQSVATVALTGASPAIDASLTNNYKITLTANNTLPNPTNLTEGMVLNFAIAQDATGGRALSFGSVYKVTGSINTAASSKSFMSCYYDGSELLCNISKGFA